MTRITLDAEQRQKFMDFREPLEICDESGTLRARLVPVLDPSRYEPVVPEISEEELERRRQEPEISTAEVLARLRDDGCSP
jgi:hypothetical protein